MKKTIEINGMHCEHCKARAEKALNGIEGVEATVNLKKNIATVKLSKDIKDELFKEALKEVELEVVSIQEKKGLFS